MVIILTLLLLQVQHSLVFTTLQGQPESRSTEQGIWSTCTQMIGCPLFTSCPGSRAVLTSCPLALFPRQLEVVSNPATLEAAYAPTLFVCAILSDVTNQSTTEAIHSGSWVQPVGICMATLSHLYGHYNRLPQFCFITDDGLCMLK